MRLKRAMAGITALAVIAGTGCFSVFAEELDNTDLMSDADTVNCEESADGADIADTAEDPADNTENTDTADTADTAEDTADITDSNEADTAETDIEEISPGARVIITNLSFPDESFREYVSNHFDSDGDDILSSYEIEEVKKIDVSGLWISNLKGIEYFTNLEELDCSDTDLTSVDLSNNTALKVLYFRSRKLTSLDVSKNIALTELYCEESRLTSLDVSNNTDLKTLYCYDNQLTSLDVSKNKALTMLHCNNNQLTSLDLSNNKALEDLICDDNQLTSINVRRSIYLSYLSCNNNKLTSLDVSENIYLKYLHCSNNQLTSLNLEKNEHLDERYSEFGDNVFNIGDVKGFFSLSELPAGFDPAKATDWKGVEYDSASNSLINFKYEDGGVIKYDYYCDEYTKVEFTLIYDSYSPNAAEKPTVTATAGDRSVTLNWNSLGNGIKYKVYGYDGKKYSSIASDITATTYTVKNLTNGTKYGFLVRAYVNGAWTSYTVNDVVYATPKGSTADKLVVTAAAGDKSVTLNWNSLGNGVKYRVYGYDGKKYSSIVSDITATSYTVKNLTNGKKYGFLVRAYINGVWSAYTVNDVVYATPNGSTSGKPAVTAIAGDKSVTLNWNSLGNGVKYRVYGYDGKKYSSIVSDITATSYTVNNLKNGTKYGFLVRAYINGAWSAYTVNDVVYATPKSGSNADKPVVTATAGNKQITLKWQSMGEGVTYKIYSYNKSTNKYTAVATVSDTSYTVKNLKNGTEYGYLVRANINGKMTAYTSADVVYATPTE